MKIQQEIIYIGPLGDDTREEVMKMGKEKTASLVIEIDGNKT